MEQTNKLAVDLSKLSKQQLDDIKYHGSRMAAAIKGIAEVTDIFNRVFDLITQSLIEEATRDGQTPKAGDVIDFSSDIFDK